MRQRVGDGQQKTVRRGHGRSHAAGRHQTRDHGGEAGNFRRRQHDDVAAHEELVDLKDAVTVTVGDRQEADSAPFLDPVERLDVREGLADDAGRQIGVQHLQFGEGRQCRRREIQQEDKQQRPCHGLTRGLHRRRGEVTHQDMRQRRRAGHHAEGQGDELPGRHAGPRIDVGHRQGLKGPKGFGRRKSANLVQGLELHNTLDRVAGGELWNQAETLLVGHPDHRQQIGDDQHDILRHLGPGDRPHAAEHRTKQNAEQAEPDADLERDSQRARSDRPRRVDLRRHIGEGRHHQDDHGEQARRVAAVAGADIVRHGIAAELAQIRRHQRGDEHVAARPPHHEGEITMAAEIDTARHGDEGSTGHPVRSRRHAVEHGGNLAAGHIVGLDLHGS